MLQDYFFFTLFLQYIYICCLEQWLCQAFALLLGLEKVLWREIEKSGIHYLREELIKGDRLEYVR